ncbi:MAG: hypothetical protein M3O70_06790 [Actinomycetota bacterium]|nr:hypothetical protein [Actinomycetota bacterium]
MDAKRIGAGVAGGIAGGLVFGAMMHMMGMIGMIAQLIGAEGAAAGWAVHLVNSAIIGAGFGLTLALGVTGWISGIGLGMVYGAIWWVLGPLLIMPLWLGMPAFQLNQTALMSLVGHLMFGLVQGAVYVAVARAPAATRAGTGRATA